MSQPLCLVTLGVRDLGVSRRFYASWLDQEPTLDLDEVVFIQVGHGLLLGLFPISELQADSGAKLQPVVGEASSPMTLAQTADSRADVDRILARAVARGARVVKPAQEVTVFNGYHCYFADPDNFLWEIAYNPGLRFDADGRASFGG
jgi:predicted lactoylglutathione lyase